ncbi:MAG: DNA polymerase III subunit delta' [Desulfovibrio sp.]|jgi:DNA polymerase-3 subunit delta'|nr:DNA polymerase III subunit delta' [Desulfovibrio sp.]
MNAAPLSITAPHFGRFTALLRNIAQAPPQVLLLEGGREGQRLDAARYWAALVNCPQAGDHGPCLTCRVCRQIVAGEHPDISLYDGRISNREDQENPGLVRAFTVDNTRLLRGRAHEAPRGLKRRVVVIMGIDQNRGEAANAMLKLLEEPLPDTLFVLLAPQREQLLPTLVSRSFCLTLPLLQPCTRSPLLQSFMAVKGCEMSPADDISDNADGEIGLWEEKLAAFLRDGRGFLEDVAARGAVDASLAEGLLLACQRACLDALARAADAPEAASGVPVLMRAARWTLEGQEALRQGVTPARVLEALAVRLFVLGRGLRPQRNRG